MAEERQHTLRLGTRGSQLARMQSQLIADLIEKTHPDVAVELVIIKTTGDQVQDRPLSEVGGKGLFTREIEQALLREEIDLAVHSYKDLPVTQPLVPQEGLVVAAVPEREDPRDVLVCQACESIESLVPGAKVGTSSLRRQCQLLAIRPDLQITPMRGNIDSRLRKVQEKQYDAIILAMAGVRRAGLFDMDWMHPVETRQLVPAAGQGALALQCRAADAATRQRLAALDDRPTRVCVDCERALVAMLEGDCHAPIGALASYEGEDIVLQAVVGPPGGQGPVVTVQVRKPADRTDDLVAEAFVELERQGAMRMLHPA